MATSATCSQVSSGRGQGKRGGHARALAQDGKVCPIVCSLACGAPSWWHGSLCPQTSLPPAGPWPGCCCRVDAGWLLVQWQLVP